MNRSLKPLGLFALALCDWAGPKPVHVNPALHRNGSNGSS
jgi:hypothetical protein